MVNIQYSLTKNHFGLSAYGHAQYAESGKDVVCAAVSILITELMFYAERAEYKRELSNLIIFEEAGDARISFDMVYQRGRHKEVLRLIIRTLKALEEDYPRHVKVSRIKHGNIYASL